MDKTSNSKRANNYFVVVLVLATGLVLAPSAIALRYYNPSSAVAQSSSSNQSKQSAAANTTGVGKIGNVKQLAKVLGNNSKVRQ